MKKKKKTKNDIFTQKKITEEDFLKSLDIISKKLIYKFKFGYHEIEDMKQQAAIFAMEGLKNYDHKRPLENFLWTHVRNRLFNYKRDNYVRPDNVCSGCPFFDPKLLKSTNQCAQFINKHDCSIYSQWESRNNIKKNIMKPANIDSADSNIKKTSHDILDFISNKELLSFIENNIETKHRETYLKIKGGIKVPKAEILKLKSHIEALIKDNL